MSCPLTLAWDERLTGYDFGPGHPLAPVRVELTMALARELGVLSRPDACTLATERFTLEPFGTAVLPATTTACDTLPLTCCPVFASLELTD